MKLDWSKRISLFESIVDDEAGEYANRWRTLPYMNRLLEQVWARHGRKGESSPVLCMHVTPPEEADGLRLNFCNCRSWIVLHEDTMCIAVLLHELTHAMGYPNHSPGFVRRYIELLGQYGRCDPRYLALHAWALKLI